MSVTTTLMVEVVNPKSEKIIVDYCFTEGAKELYSTIKLKNFFRYYKVAFNKKELINIDNLNKNIEEQHLEEIAGVVQSSELIRPEIILEFIESVYYKCSPMAITFSKPKSFFNRDIGKRRLSEILAFKVFEGLERKGEERYDNYIEFHRKRLNRLFRILSILKVISSYSKGMNHCLIMKFKFE